MAWDLRRERRPRLTRGDGLRRRRSLGRRTDVSSSATPREIVASLKPRWTCSGSGGPASSNILSRGLTRLSRRSIDQPPEWEIEWVDPGGGSSPPPRSIGPSRCSQIRSRFRPFGGSERSRRTCPCRRRSGPLEVSAAPRHPRWWSNNRRDHVVCTKSVPRTSDPSAHPYGTAQKAEAVSSKKSDRCAAADVRIARRAVKIPRERIDPRCFGLTFT